MQFKKNNPDKVINLQSGMYCHVGDEFLVINSSLNLEEKDYELKLHKTRNIRKTRITLNVLYSSLILIFAVYSGFYPFSLLLFVSLWDIRQLGRYTLPLNLSNCIPIKNIESIKITKGGMGFNYMDVMIVHEGVKSLKPLKLYDSASTFEQSKLFAESIGKLTSIHQNTKEKITGEKFPLNEVEAYILRDNKLYYCHHELYNPERKDNYLYIRSLSLVLVGIGVYALILKMHLMSTSYYNYVDFAVLVFFVLVLLIPIKYLRKALPNEIEVESIKKITHEKNTLILHVELKNKFVLRVHLPKKHLKNQSNRLSELVKK